MGCTDEQGCDCEDNEKPARKESVSDFYIGKYEVTQRLWRAVMDTDSILPFNGGCEDCPMENVSWKNAQEFIGRLNAMTGKTFRLPTEAEWEYAARGGHKSKHYKYSGSNQVSEVAWHVGNSSGGQYGDFQEDFAFLFVPPDFVNAGQCAVVVHSACTDNAVGTRYGNSVCGRCRKPAYFFPNHHHLGNPATPYRTTGNTGQYQLTTVNYQPLIINCKE